MAISAVLDIRLGGRETPLSDDAREQALVERCLAGEAEAFRPIVERHQRRIFSVALRMLGSRSDAEDVAQQTFVDAYRALDRFDATGRANALATWLLRIAINRSKDVLKSKKRTEQSLDSDGDVPAGEAMFSRTPVSPESHTSRLEERRALEKALAVVPVKYREALVLKDIEDLSYDEMRAILRLPITTLKIRVVRARAMMRAALGELAR